MKAKRLKTKSLTSKGSEVFLNFKICLLAKIFSLNVFMLDTLIDYHHHHHHRLNRLPSGLQAQCHAIGFCLPFTGQVN